MLCLPDAARWTVNGMFCCIAIQILLAWLFRSAKGKLHGEPEDVLSVEAAMDLTKAHEAVVLDAGERCTVTSCCIRELTTKIKHAVKSSGTGTESGSQSCYQMYIKPLQPSHAQVSVGRRAVLQGRGNYSLGWQSAPNTVPHTFAWVRAC